MLVDPAGLVTLPDASERLGLSPVYWRQMRRRYPDGFPEPVATIGGNAVYLISDLVEWRAARGDRRLRGGGAARGS